ncbi:tetratricopeptide repeat protein [Luedemannella flava]
MSALRCLSEVALDSGDLDTARQLAQAAIDLARETNHRRQLAIAIATLADVDRADGTPTRAIERGAEALDLVRQANDNPVEAYLLIGLSEAHADLGDHETAYAQADRAVALGEAGRYTSIAGRALTARARAGLLAGHRDAAATDARRAAETLRACGHLLGEARALVALGHATGGPAGADAWRAALALFEAAAVPEAAAVRSLLDHDPGR